jgi:hypothetical protein
MSSREAGVRGGEWERGEDQENKGREFSLG